MIVGEAHFRLGEELPSLPKTERLNGLRAHSFAPLISSFAGDGWRLSSEGIFTHVRPAGENSPGEPGFEIRFSVHPAIADEVLRSAVPIIVTAGCPFKVISNTALLELVCSKRSSQEPPGEFLTIYPPSQQIFNDLIPVLQRATDGITTSFVPGPWAGSGGQPRLSPDNPWPGLDCFLPGESTYFFGRKDEQLDLAQRIEREIVTVVLGQPGVGKTSLLRAGLKPVFDRMRFEPVYLRLNGAGLSDPVQQVRDEINHVLRERQIDGAPFGEGQTLWEYFHFRVPAWVAADGKPVVPVLIFDQFEEVLSLNLVQALWTQLTDLVENRVPESPGQLSLPHVGSRPAAASAKVVISLRQVYLPELLARGAAMPSITESHFLVQPFNGPKALEAVLGPGRHLLDTAHPDAAAEKIIRRLGREAAPSDGGPLDNMRIQPALLSFFCQQLNEARKRSRQGEPDAGLITAELVDAEAEPILEDFFQRTGQARRAQRPPQTVVLQKDPKPEEKKPSSPEVQSPQKSPVLAEAGYSGALGLKNLAIGFVAVLVIMLAVAGNLYRENLERQHTEVELQEYIRRLEARNTFKSANRKLTLAEATLATERSNLWAAEATLALEKSNLLASDKQARDLEQEILQAKQKNSRLAREQTNVQTHLMQVNHENAQAEAQLAQRSRVLFDLTNQIAFQNKQIDAVQSRYKALALADSVDYKELASNTPAAPASTNQNPAAPAAGSPASPDITAVVNSSSPREVYVIMTHGKCRYSENDEPFNQLRTNQVLHAGATIRTYGRSWADLFFRRTGTTVRVAPESEMRIVKLSQSIENGVPLIQTLVELHSGRIVTTVRALVPGNVFEISDATGRSVIEGGGLGCFMITAPKPNSRDKLLVTPLRLVSQEGPSNVVDGKNYNAANGTNLTLIESQWEGVLIQLDEMESETDRAIAEPQSPDSPKNN
jgi:hypothetical protein